MQLPHGATHPGSVLALHSCPAPHTMKLATDWARGQGACKGARPIPRYLDCRQSVRDHRVNSVKRCSVEFALNAQQPDGTALTRQTFGVLAFRPRSIFQKIMLQSARGF